MVLLHKRMDFLWEGQKLKLKIKDHKGSREQMQIIKTNAGYSRQETPEIIRTTVSDKESSIERVRVQK